MKKVIHKADTRGHSQYDWLDSYHTFSFDEYFDSDRINFGALRVLNDDKVAPGQGFPLYPYFFDCLRQKYMFIFEYLYFCEKLKDYAY